MELSDVNRTHSACLACLEVKSDAKSYCDNPTHVLCGVCMHIYLQTHLNDAFCRPITCCGAHFDTDGKSMKQRLPYMNYKSLLAPFGESSRLSQAKKTLMILCNSCHSQRSLLVCPSDSERMETQHTLQKDCPAVLPLVKCLEGGRIGSKDFFGRLSHVCPGIFDIDVSVSILWINRVAKLIADPELRCSIQLHYFQQQPIVVTECCLHEHCFRCKTVSHDGISCTENSESLDNSLVFCPNCSVVLTKGDGCALVTCVCGESFNWVEQVETTQNALEFSTLYPRGTALHCASLLTAEDERKHDYALNLNISNIHVSLGGRSPLSYSDAVIRGDSITDKVLESQDVSVTERLKSAREEVLSKKGLVDKFASDKGDTLLFKEVKCMRHDSKNVTDHGESYLDRPRHVEQDNDEDRCICGHAESDHELTQAEAWRLLNRRESDVGLVQWWDIATKPYQAHAAACMLRDEGEEDFKMTTRSNSLNSMASGVVSSGENSNGRIQQRSRRAERAKLPMDARRLAAQLWATKHRVGVEHAMQQIKSISGDIFLSMYPVSDRTRVAVGLLRGEVTVDALEDRLCYQELKAGAAAYLVRYPGVGEQETKDRERRRLEQWLVLYGREAVQSVVPSSSYTPVRKPFNMAISNAQLNFSSYAYTVARPGCVSSYPAAMVDLPSHQTSITLSIDEAPLALNWLTLGLSKGCLDAEGSDGYGVAEHTWGLRDDRCRGNDREKFCGIYTAAHGAGAPSCAHWRKLKAGDVVSMVVDLLRGRMMMELNHGELQYEFEQGPVGNPSEFFFGVTLSSDCRVSIVPSVVSKRALRWMRSGQDSGCGTKDVAVSLDDTTRHVLNPDHSTMYLHSVNLLRKLFRIVEAQVAMLEQKSHKHVSTRAISVFGEGEGVYDEYDFYGRDEMSDDRCVDIEASNASYETMGGGASNGGAREPLPTLLHLTPTEVAQKWWKKWGGPAATIDGHLKMWAVTMERLGVEGVSELVQRSRHFMTATPSVWRVDDLHRPSVEDDSKSSPMQRMQSSVTWMDVASGLYWVSLALVHDE